MASRKSSGAARRGPPATITGTGDPRTASTKSRGSGGIVVCTIPAPSSAIARTQWASPVPGAASVTGGCAMPRTGRPRPDAASTTRPASESIRSSATSPKWIWTDTASAPSASARSGRVPRTFDVGRVPSTVPAERWTTSPADVGRAGAIRGTSPGFAMTPVIGAPRSALRRATGSSIPGRGPAGRPWSRARRRKRPPGPSRRRSRREIPGEGMAFLACSFMEDMQCIYTLLYFIHRHICLWELARPRGPAAPGRPRESGPAWRGGRSGPGGRPRTGVHGSRSGSRRGVGTNRIVPTVAFIGSPTFLGTPWCETCGSGT